eukprot:Plantae.Rhodophyta-Purpureofilum_apyrenoidigerum.ctg8030.p1 GENE.Plantae.Rhodophyta-Purpureofilum_apyrenoidigerum.ctg8030~~Plantae.Rhodophyta-Purpureofilum_apyrenoidigerum.ctg8030.p1  ORF type:complete len:780 (-),score=114.31 Plantae.Rhodophyta-Purpureofilum_apyrenoidigerum.ctg8030:27-2366(-)
MNMLEHPNIVKLHQVLTTREHIYIVMELVTGGELYDEIMSTEPGGLEEWEARRYFRQLIDGVHHCHSQGVYHRDLKPENLLLDENNRLKITDFGFSTLKQGLDRVNDVLYTQCGTPTYVAPEIINPPKDGYSGAKVDIWSCGVILYMMVAGEMPFDDENMDRLFTKIATGSVSYPMWFSPALKDLLSGMFRVNHRSRYSIEEIQGHPWFNYKAEEVDISASSMKNTTTTGSPLLAKTNSVHVGHDQDVDFASDAGLSNRQASDFTDYTLDLSISEFGKIMLRDRTRDPESRQSFHMHDRQGRSRSDVGETNALHSTKASERCIEPVSTSSRRRISQSTSNRHSLLSRKELEVVPCGGPFGPVRSSVSSSSDSEDGGQPSTEAKLDEGRDIEVQCVTCGSAICQPERAPQLQYICEKCNGFRNSKKLVSGGGPHRHTAMLDVSERMVAHKKSSLDERVFCNALESEIHKPSDGRKSEAAVDLVQPMKIHADWELACLEEMEEHGRKLDVLNNAWSEQLLQVWQRGQLSSVKRIDSILLSGAADSSAKDLDPVNVSPSDSRKRPNGRASRQSSMLRDPSRPWKNKGSQADQVKPTSEALVDDGVQHDPFRAPAVKSPTSHYKSRLAQNKILPDPCRDQAMQDVSTTGVYPGQMHPGPITPTVSTVPRVFEGLRTLKHRGQQRKFFDSLCSPSLLANVLRQVLSEMECDTHVRASRSESFKLSTTIRPPKVSATLSTNIEVYRKSDALSKVSVRKTRGSRQDFMLFFTTMKDKYAQCVHSLL